MAFGGDLGGNDAPMSDINMTPLVDVMLVLLIIFIITVPVLTHSVKVDLPRERAAVDEIEPETVMLSVTADAKIFWNELPIGEDELEQRLATIAGKDPQPEVHIRGDRSVDYEHVVRLMAISHRAGIETLGFVMQPEP
jgi:biopolymer transport protein ExbD